MAGPGRPEHSPRHVAFAARRELSIGDDARACIKEGEGAWGCEGEFAWDYLE